MKWTETSRFYIQKNQSDKLHGIECRGDTWYYAIGGSASLLLTAFFPENVYKLELNLDTSSNFTIQDFEEAIKNALKNESHLKLGDLPRLGGDNVVSLYSQFGIKVDGNDENIEELWTLRPPQKKRSPFG